MCERECVSAAYFWAAQQTGGRGGCGGDIFIRLLLIKFHFIRLPRQVNEPRSSFACQKILCSLIYGKRGDKNRLQTRAPHDDKKNALENKPIGELLLIDICLVGGKTL